MELDLESSSESKRAHVRLRRVILAAVIVNHLLLVASVWGQWRNIAIITATFVLVAAVNMTLARPIFSEQSRSTELMRLLSNVLTICVYGHFTGWAFPMWLYIPLDAIWVDTHRHPRARFLLFGAFSVVGLVAVLDGCSPLVPLGFIVLAVLVHAISSARLDLLRTAMGRLTQRHQELAQAHQRGLEQDRLSSLGMLAAGVAHEINNPLAYVKSNIHALSRDLRDQKELPPALAEYLTEVLPATLDGVERIATIVSDLRRFARRDPEPLVEYDLNAEVEAALRITHGRLAPHCQVELDLGPLPRMTGRPRQMAQVVINLLINAAQAMTERGKIFLTTRQEGQEVVLVVRDTGQGMTPEVRSRLFQPFFSTKPLGEGTGMGLAVVHGIVSAHGGSIQVESEAGRGSTFTIRLPPVPPAPPVAAE